MAWTAGECADLARAWIGTTEDPIRGVDQTSQLFYSTMFERFCSLAPPGSSSKQYHGRQLRPVRAKWEAMAADCQKFRAALRFIRACKPTGVTEDEIMCMAVAKHLGKRTSMNYDARTFPEDKWVYHLAFRVLRRVPKFGEQNDVGVDDDGLFEDNGNYCNGESAGQINEAQDNNGNEERETSVANKSSDIRAPTMTGLSTGSLPDSDTGGSTAEESGNERVGNRSGHPGRKKAKKDAVKERLHLIALENAQTIAQAMKRRVELIEQKNALQAFSIQECVTEEEKRDRAEFLRLTRAAHMRRIREREGIVTPAPESFRDVAATGSVNSAIDIGQSINSSHTTVPPLGVTTVHVPGVSSTGVEFNAQLTHRQGDQVQGVGSGLDSQYQTLGFDSQDADAQARILHARATPNGTQQ